MKCDHEVVPNRRAFLSRAMAATSAALLAPALLHAKENANKGEKEEKGEEDVSPAEDLMREHGILKRVLFIYEEAIRRIGANEDLPPEAVLDSAKIIRTFIEDYHEQ